MSLNGVHCVKLAGGGSATGSRAAVPEPTSEQKEKNTEGPHPETKQTLS